MFWVLPWCGHETAASTHDYRRADMFSFSGPDEVVLEYSDLKMFWALVSTCREMRDRVCNPRCRKGIMVSSAAVKYPMLAVQLRYVDEEVDYEGLFKAHERLRSARSPSMLDKRRNSGMPQKIRDEYIFVIIVETTGGRTAYVAHPEETKHRLAKRKLRFAASGLVTPTVVDELVAREYGDPGPEVTLVCLHRPTGTSCQLYKSNRVCVHREKEFNDIIYHAAPVPVKDPVGVESFLPNLASETMDRLLASAYVGEDVNYSADDDEMGIIYLGVHLETVSNRSNLSGAALLALLEHDLTFIGGGPPYGNVDIPLEGDVVTADLQEELLARHSRVVVVEPGRRPFQPTTTFDDYVFSCQIIPPFTAGRAYVAHLEQRHDGIVLAVHDLPRTFGDDPKTRILLSCIRKTTGNLALLYDSGVSEHPNHSWPYERVPLNRVGIEAFLTNLDCEDSDSVYTRATMSSSSLQFPFHVTTPIEAFRFNYHGVDPIHFDLLQPDAFLAMLESDLRYIS